LPPSNYQVLLQALDYQFKEPRLLERALTHRSKSNRNYERLEFLGDSILGFTISAELYQRYPDFPEGKLTRLRASLVRQGALATLGRQLELGQFLRLGSGELKSGGHDRDSILSDTVESIFGAVYLDGGFYSARKVILGLYGNILDEMSPDKIEKDPKTRLQEYLQKYMKVLPEYHTTKVTGAPHEQNFLVECRVPGIVEVIQGEAKSRRAAEQEAASKAFELLTKGKNVDTLS
jgi:ribonuclease III